MADDPSHKTGSVGEEPSLEYQFATTTTLHGIGRVADSSGARAKIPWVLALLIAGGFCAFVTIDRTQAYLKFEANTNVIVEFHKTLEFPAVTICNYNRFMNSKISEDEKKYVSHLLELNEDLYGEDDDFNATAYDILFDDEFNYTHFALATGFALDDSLIQCDWKGVPYSCKVGNFSSFYSPSHGQCYTFTTHSTHQKLAQSQQGTGNGLQLIVNIQQNEYTETVSSGHVEAGLRFAIHPPDELPLIDTMGLSASPGFHTYASMRLVRHINLPKPWGVCGTEATEESRKYSRNTCLRNCRRDAIIKRCSCQPLGYERAVKSDSSLVPLCDIEQFNCVMKALEVHRSLVSLSECTCPIACDYVTYETTLSTAKYPSQSVSTEIDRAFQGDADISDGYVKENFVYLDVYYSELSTITYEQVQAMPFTALLGDLGGQLGLFLGASVITGVELLDYILRRLNLLILRVKTKKKVQSGNS
ncbi:acid-sensing ion channel 1A-like [Patiria miniata]|uniref:Uncharacterized protein n=1 Tax=Patiria miniata TaxID=46514 RepID=A0A913ZEV8_PATMI|nr:acid-sensing ion channel 1A-like [Patiria miniata]